MYNVLFVIKIEICSIFNHINKPYILINKYL